MSKSKEKQPIIRPIVIDWSDKFRDEGEDKVYSDTQDIFDSMVEVSARVARAIAKGLDTYLDASETSAKNKKDGTLRDLGVNSAKGLSEALRELALIPVDVAEKLNSEERHE